MKKAKNAFAIIAIILAVVAAILAVGLPAIDAILAQQLGTIGSALSTHLQNLLNSIKGFVTFGWISADIGAHLIEFVALGIGGVGVILFIVLFILMLCKKHAKGLGWFFPMLILFVLSVAVIAANKFDNAGYAVTSFVEVAYFGKAGTIVAIVAGALFILSVIFYMVYVCKARKAQKKVQAARNAAIAKIDALLGGNK